MADEVTQADIDALNAAIRGKVLTVKYGDNLTTYRSTAELIAARNDAEAQLAKATGKRASRCAVAAHSRD